jgi:site-specific DNA-methyltransferase (adenine-specific)
MIPNTPECAPGDASAGVTTLPTSFGRGTLRGDAGKASDGDLLQRQPAPELPPLHALKCDLRGDDCIDYLRALDTGSVDLIIADPPYNIGFDGGKGWDRQWDNEADYLTWCAEWTRECARVLAEGRMLIVWGTLKTDTFLRYKLDVLNSLPGMVGQNEVIWSYNWGGRSKANFGRKHELAWCYSKGERFLFNGDDVRVPRKMTSNPRTGQPYTNGTIPTCVWEKNNHTTSDDFCGWHPTSKNLDILTRMITAYTNPGDLVCDPFSGSGSTAIAALRAGRSFTGTELDPDYLAQSRARIDASRQAISDRR